MSGQWEVVGRKKDKNSKVATKNEKKDKKKNHIIELNMEEVLPKSQVKNLYNSDKNKENKKQEKGTKPQENNVKKQQKKPEKPQEPPKPKPPKSIESALIAIDVEEFKNIFEKSKQHFPDAPIVWLKELTQYLNQKVPVEIQDPIFASRPDGYPYNVVPSPLRSIIEKSIKEAGKANARLFFDISLTSMATDMSKGLSALGYKFYLQHIANSDPTVATSSMNKHIVLRNSYQNRPTVGLSILWAVGQTGIKDFTTGLRVFQDMMLPLIEMKNYSKYIVSYLINLIKNHKTESLTKEQYLLIIDLVFSNRKNFPTELKQDLVRLAPDLKHLLFNFSTSDKSTNFVETFLRKLNTHSNKPYQDCLCDIIVGCFIRDSSSLNSWNTLYDKNLSSSVILLNYIDNHWQPLVNRLHTKTLSTLLNNFKAANEQLSLKKRKDEGLQEAINVIQKLNDKMTKKGKSGFPLKSLLFLIALGSSLAVYVDVKHHGSWKDCRTNKVLVDSGIHEYTHKALNRTKEGLLWVDARVEKSFPGVHKTVADFSEPYVQLTKDLGLVGYNLCANIRRSIVERYPVVIQTIDSYAPGLMESSQKAVVNAWTTSSVYLNNGVEYLRTEVFIGKLAPEHVKRVVLEAFNTTQHKAAEYYHWLYEKVQSTIK